LSPLSRHRSINWNRPNRYGEHTKLKAAAVSIFVDGTLAKFHNWEKWWINFAELIIFNFITITKCRVSLYKTDDDPKIAITTYAKCKLLFLYCQIISLSYILFAV